MADAGRSPSIRQTGFGLFLGRRSTCFLIAGVLVKGAEPGFVAIATPRSGPGGCILTPKGQRAAEFLGCFGHGPRKLAALIRYLWPGINPRWAFGIGRNVYRVFCLLLPLSVASCVFWPNAARPEGPKDGRAVGRTKPSKADAESPICSGGWVWSRSG